MKSKYNPLEALELLKAGNERFLQDQNNYRNHTSKTYLKQIAQNASPFAIVLTCADSRVPPEHIFDAGLGDIIVIRNAGNILDTVAMATVEFTVQSFGVNLLVILGHTHCEAIKATIRSIANPVVQESSHINFLINLLRPAAQHSRPLTADASNKDWIEKATLKNVQLNLQSLKSKSTVISDLMFRNEFKIVGGIYDVTSGKVEFI